ncbi:hypothetical protein [Leptolyngbya sp. DQ-M1]|uniref:hypothetical protein n=1 Tax=Leptolyngbya sp. DQ-M1 TaxID=2933920 RepID=UPI003296CF4F
MTLNAPKLWSNNHTPCEPEATVFAGDLRVNSADERFRADWKNLRLSSLHLNHIRSPLLQPDFELVTSIN